MADRENSVEDLGRGEGIVRETPVTPTAEAPAAQATPAAAAPAMTSEINVTIARVGETPVSVKGPDGMTVNEAMAKAGITPDGMDIRVNRNNADGNQRLTNGQLVLLIPRIRGGEEQ